MDTLIKEGFISRKLAKTDKGNKADAVLKVWCCVNKIPTEESCKKIIGKLEKESSINQEISMPYDILAVLGALDYPQSKFDKIAAKCEDIDYKWLLWVDERDPNYEKMKNTAIKIWKAGQYKVIAPNGGGDYLIYSLKNGKFFDYFHEQDTGEKLDWLKSGVTYRDAINQVKKNIAEIQSKNQTSVKEGSLYEAMTYIDNYLTIMESKEKEAKFDNYSDYNLKMIQRSNKRELKNDAKSLAVDAVGVGASAALAVKLKKSLDKTNDELKEELAKKEPDDNKIKKLKKKIVGIKIKLAALTGVGAVAAYDAQDASKYVHKNYDNYKSAGNVLKKREENK